MLAFKIEPKYRTARRWLQYAYSGNDRKARVLLSFTGCYH